jgi:hypothetical protein
MSYALRMKRRVLLARMVPQGKGARTIPSALLEFHMKNRSCRLLFNLVLGCSLMSCSETTTGPAYPSVEEIQEAVIRFELYDNEAGYIDRGVIAPSLKYLVFAAATVDTARDNYPNMFFEMPESFLDRFHEVGRPIVKYAQVVREPGRPLVEATTHGSALLVRAGPIRWKQLHQIEVFGGYYAGGMNSEVDVLFMTLRNGRWAVDSLRIVHRS